MKRIGALLLCLVLLCATAVPVCAIEVDMRAEDFFYNYGTDEYGDPITDIRNEYEMEYILMGEEFWVQLSEQRREEINALFLRYNQRTYIDLLAEAKEWDAMRAECEGNTEQLESVSEFLKYCATDAQGRRITEVTVDNVANVIAGAIIWEELIFGDRMRINVALKDYGQPAYQELMAEAEVLLEDMIAHPERYTTVATTTTTAATTTMATTTTATTKPATTAKAITMTKTKAATTIYTTVTTTTMSAADTTVSTTSTTTATTGAVATDTEQSGLSVGAVIAIVCGGVLIAAGIVTAVIVRMKKK